VEQATGRSAPRTNVFSAAAGNLAAPAAAFASSSGLGKAAPAVPRPRSRSPARVAAVAAALNAADARGLASAEEESRRHERHVMEKPFLRQWRGLTLADRPLPPPGYADSGLVCDGVWSDGLKGAAKERTVELLKSERWKTTREHSSVRLTLYLRWAEDRLRQRSAERIAGLDLGRHIQGLL
jgi:hypothetical protein